MVRGSEAHGWFKGSEGESYWLTYWASYGLTLGLIGFGAHAWLMQGELFQAFLCLASQLIAISVGVLARRAIHKGSHWFYWLIAAGSMLFLASIAEMGIQNAWRSSGSAVPLNEAQSWFIALLEPLLIWWVEEIRFKRREGAEIADVEKEKNPVPLENNKEPVQSVYKKEPQDSAQPSKTHQRPSLQALNGGLAAAVGVSALLQPEIAIHEAAGRVAAESPLCPREKARELLASGDKGPTEVHKACPEVPLGTIKRWAAEMKGDLRRAS